MIFIFKYEKKYFEKTTTLNTKIFIAGGDQDYGINDIVRLMDQIKSRNYKGLELKTTVLKDIGHAGTTAEGFNRGLIELFAKTSLALDTSVLDEYVGTYRRKQGDEFRLFRKGAQLIMQYSDKITLLLYSETKEEFYIKGIYIFFKFSKADIGKIKGVNVKYDGGEGYYEKIN